MTEKTSNTNTIDKFCLDTNNHVTQKQKTNIQDKNSWNVQVKKHEKNKPWLQRKQLPKTF